MLKVALTLPALGDGRSISTPVISTLIRYLASRVELHVFPLRHPFGDGDLPCEGAVVHRVSNPHLRMRALVPEVLGKIRREHQAGRFDLVHALWLYEPGAIGITAARMLGVPSVVSIGGSEVVRLPDIGYGGIQTRRGLFIQRQVLRRATLVTGGSSYILDLAARVHSRADGYHYAPLPVDTTVFRLDGRTLLPDRARPRLLHAASLIPVKDQTTLLSAFARIHATIPGAVLSLAGEDPFGHRKELEDLAKSLGVSQAVCFLGAVPHSEMAALYREADLFLLSSRHESQGMVVLEAAASGVPTAGTAVGVLADLAPKAAVAVPPQTPDRLAEEVVSLLGNPDRLRRLGAEAHCRATTEFAGDVAVDRFVALYERALERHSR